MIYDQQSEGRLILIGVGLDYYGTSNPLLNPTNDIREIGFALSSLSKTTNKEFVFIPMLQQHTLADPQINYPNNYPNPANLNSLFDTLKNKQDINISALAYDGEFTSSFSLTSEYDTFGSPITMEPLNNNDTLIFYYSGHGVDYNGNLSIPKEYDIGDRQQYTLDTLYSNISDLESKSLVILDSCFSGTLIKESSTSINKAETPFVDRLPALYQKFFNYANDNGIYEKFSIIASTKSGELSWPIKPSDLSHTNSIFTYYFLEALGYISDIDIGEMSDSILSKKNNKIDIDSIYNYVNKNITGQQPIIMGGRKSLVLFTFN